MFIVRDKTTLLVAMLAADAPVLDGAGLQIGDTRFIAITPDTHEVVEGAGPESLFIPGHLVFDGAWAAIDQGAYDAAVAARFPLDGLKSAKRAAVTALLDTKLAAGYPHDFGGEIGTKILQTRDIHDRTNWLVSQASYGAAVAGGAGAVMGANFRTADNVNITLSYADGLNVLLAMAGWGAAHYARSWVLKDAIAAAADEAALDAIDIGSGWPS